MKTKNKGIEIPDYLVFIMYLENEGKCASDVFRELDITYKHIHEMKHTFLKEGWVYLVKETRRHNMFLTSKGKDLVNIAKELLNFMDITMEDILDFIQEGKLKKKEKIDGKKLLEDVKEDLKSDKGQILLY